jgi:hypothetical protein
VAAVDDHRGVERDVGEPGHQDGELDAGDPAEVVFAGVVEVVRHDEPQVRAGRLVEDAAVAAVVDEKRVVLAGVRDEPLVRVENARPSGRRGDQTGDPETAGLQRPGHLLDVVEHTGQAVGLCTDQERFSGHAAL